MLQLNLKNDSSCHLKSFSEKHLAKKFPGRNILLINEAIGIPLRFSNSYYK